MSNKNNNSDSFDEIVNNITRKIEDKGFKVGEIKKGKTKGKTIGEWLGLPSLPL